MRNKLARLEAEEPNPQTQPAEVLREWNREVDFAEAGVRTEEDYLNIKRVREYRLWQWWLDQEHMDLNAILQDRNSHVEATGKCNMNSVEGL